MRLTLRTLLAYLDGVLESADHDDLQRQIEASDFARDLIHRTRDVSRRLRLGASDPLGAGPIDDPNTMAEYLDNTLPVESVPEFERHCLESDAMLAEAAASHHVLAMVLGRPAEVDPETRQRVHSLPATLSEAERRRVDASHRPAAVPDADAEGLPDYLRENDRSALLRWAPAIAAAALLAVTAYLTFRPVPEPASGEVAAASGVGVADAGDAATPPDAVDPPREAAAPAPEEALVGAAPEAASSDDPAPASDAAHEGVTDAPPVELDEPEVEPAPDEAVATTLPNPPAANAVGEPPIGDAEAVAVNLDVVAAAEVGEAPVDEPEPIVAEIEPPSAAGSFVGPRDSLFVAEAGPDVWRRLAVDAPLRFEARVIALPTYRGDFELWNGVLLTLVDLSEVVFPELDPGEVVASMELRYGRVLITNPTDEPRSLRLLVDGVTKLLELDGGAMLAIESERAYTPAFDFMGASPPSVTRVYAPQGGVTWSSGGLDISPERGKQWEVAMGVVGAVSDYRGDPGWIESLNLTPWDRESSPMLALAVAQGQEVWPQLQEVIDNDPRKDVRALAARCSAAVGHPDPLVEAFSDELQTAVWADSLIELRKLCSRSRLEAERVMRSLESRYGEEAAADMFRMIRGFEAAGGDIAMRDDLAQILDWLDSEAIEVRVLANLNLEELTGRQGVFGPTGTRARRDRELRRIRKWFRDEELVVTRLGR